MNHLGVDGKGRVVFDAGDATNEGEDDELAEADELMVDLAKLRGEQIYSIAAVDACNRP
jgi:condensin complex subunit 2